MTTLRYWLIPACVGLSLTAATCPADTPSAAPATAPAPLDTANLSARATIEKVIGQALVVLRDTKISHDERKLKVQQLAYEFMDFDTMARLTLGRYWKDVPEDKRAEFVTEFRKHISATYGHTTDGYNNEDVTITGDRQETHGDVTVLTRIYGNKEGGGKEEVAKVDYRMRLTGNHWRIVDVTIEGVSLVANFRSQFQEVVANGGINKLLELLRAKNVAANATPPTRG